METEIILDFENKLIPAKRAKSKGLLSKGGMQAEVKMRERINWVDFWMKLFIKTFF